MKQNNYPEALGSFDAATRLEPDLAFAHLSNSKVLLLLAGRHSALTPETITILQSAKASLESSIGFELPTPDHYIVRGEILASFGEIEQALSDFDKAIDSHPDRAKTHHSRGKAQASNGDFQSALVDFDAAIQIDPSNGQYLIDRGIIFQILGDFVRSEADFQAARNLGLLEARVDSNGSPLTWGASYFSKYPIAPFTFEENDIATYKGVVSLLPSTWRAYLNLAESHFNLGQFDEALAQLDVLLEVPGVLADPTPAFALRGKVLSELN